MLGIQKTENFRKNFNAREVGNTTDDKSLLEYKMVRDENEYLKKQLIKLRDRNIKLDMKLIEEDSEKKP